MGVVPSTSMLVLCLSCFLMFFFEIPFLPDKKRHRWEKNTILGGTFMIDFFSNKHAVFWLVDWSVSAPTGEGGGRLRSYYKKNYPGSPKNV